MQKVDALMIGNELNGAGVKDGTLPASKLKTDVDADKIQLENLSAEVLENMSGQAAATANTAAATADQATADAIDAAALAESKAALADEKAAYAVTKADLAQTAKDHADQKAALAQTQADYAKTQGDYGKAQGDYAKAQGDLAKGVVAGVIPNATQAASGLMSPTDKSAVDNGQKFALTNVTGSGKNVTDADLNKTISAGFYNVLLTDKNTPTDITGTLTVTTRASSVIMQSFQSQRNETFTRHSSDSGSTWTIWKKSTDENTLTNILLGNKTTIQTNVNLVGKVSGSTTANPHIAKVSTGIGVQLPQGFTVEFTQDRYNLLANLDSSHVVTSNPVAGVVSQHLISFNVIEHVQRTYGVIPGSTTAEKVTWLRANVSKLTFNWWGYGTGPAGNKANTRIWVFGAWQGATSTTNASSTKVTLGTSSSSYIQDDGFMHCLAYAEPSDGTTASVIYSDFAELIVEFSVDVKSNLLLNGVQGYKLTKDDGLVIRLADNTDLNTILETGLYYIVTPSNAPELNNGWYIDVKKLSSTYTTQKATINNATKQTEYVRHYFNGTWTTWSRSVDSKQLFTKMMGNTVIDSSLANFVGKVSGSTTVNPHKSIRTRAATLTNPINATPELDNTMYTTISTLDGNTQSSSLGGTQTAGDIAQHVFGFDLIAHVERTYGSIPAIDTAGKIAWLRSNVNKLTCNWYGYGNNPAGNKALLTVWVNNGWAASSTHTKDTPSLLVRMLATQWDKDNGILADGMVYFLAHADPADGTNSSIIRTDYVELVVELSTNSRKSLLAQGIQGHKLTTDTGTAITPPNGTDFNLLTDTGYYVYSNDNAHKGSPNGYPYWLVEVTKYSATLSVQMWKGIVHDETLVRRTVTGGWSPFRKNVDENGLANVVFGNKPTFLSMANFVGKVWGSVTVNPHVFKRANSSPTLFAPSGFGAEPAQIEYDKISVMDGSCSSIPTMVAGNFSQMLFSFNLVEHVQRTYGVIPGASISEKVTWLKANVSKLTVNWFGFGQNPVVNRANLKLWNGSNWATFNTTATHTNSSVAKLTDLMVTGAQIGVGIQSDGFVHATAYAEVSDSSAASVINTDYVELQVELSTDIKANLSTATQTEKGLLSPTDKTIVDNGQQWKVTDNTGDTQSVAGANFDTVLKSGFYFANPSNSNVPFSYQNVMVTSKGGDVTQLAINVQQPGMAMRVKPNGLSFTPWRRLNDINSLISSIMGNSVTDQSAMNFLGKTPGNTTVNPHIAKYGYQTSLQHPTTGTVGEFETDTLYQEISSLNGVSQRRTRAESGVISQQIFSFNVLTHIERLYGTIPAGDTAGKVAWLKANITKLTATWHGFGSAPAGNKASLTRWDANAGAWLSTAVTGTTHTGSGVLPLTFTPGVATSIDANGFIHLLVYAEPSDGTTASVIHTDFVEVKVDLDTSLKKNLAPIWIDAVLQNGWADFTTAQKPKYSLGADGFVQLRGGVKDGTLGNATPIMTLPVGFRPAVNQYFSVPGYAQYVYRITVDTTGKVMAETASGGVTNTFVALDGIRFSIS